MCLFGLFKKKNNSNVSNNNFLSKMIEMQNKINKSFNYQFVFRVIRNTFFAMDFDSLYKNEKVLNEYLKFCAQAVVNETGLQMDSRFLNLKYYFGNNDAGDKSVIIEFEGPWEADGECNYIALFKPLDDKSYIYTSEYHSNDNTFRLCKELGHNIRLWAENQITDLNSFLDIIDQKL